MSCLDTCQQGFSGASGQSFLTLLQMLATTTSSINSTWQYQDDFQPKLFHNQVFDYIIVGAGSAGSTLANRLSEDNTSSVLLLEAGGLPSMDSEIPGYSLHNIDTDIDWQYQTEPMNTSCLGLIGNKSKWPRGKVLGGSSAINGMIYIRGNQKDFDSWEAAGNTGWNWENVTDYYKKSENCIDPNLMNDDRHGTEGFLKTSKVHSKSNLRNIMLESAKQLGTPFLDDIENGGFVEALTTIDDGTRCSAAKAYLSTIQRSNLQIALNSQVTRIIFRGNQTIGVRVNKNGKIISLFARREVILSAGAVNSPQLLMLSGVGPRKNLEEVGVKVVKELPVGKNLQDHLRFIGAIIKIDPSADEDMSPAKSQSILFEYFSQRKGPLGTIDVNNLLWFLSTKNSMYPDIQMQFRHLAHYDKQNLQLTTNSYNLNEKTTQSLNEAIDNSIILIPLIALLTPKSRGSIELATTNPYSKPKIIANYLSEQQDVDTLVKSIALLKKLLKTDAMKAVKADFLQYELTPCSNLTIDTPDYWMCLVRSMGVTGSHPAGTCKMGPLNDPTAVVDPELRVHGLTNLRVVDASIMPTIVSGHLNAPTIMIAEKAADMIKQTVYSSIWN